MLAARSPVLAGLLSNGEEIEYIHLVVDCTTCDMNQLLQFIYTQYTGEVKGCVSHALMQLAKYKVKTLNDICQSGFQDAFDLSMGKMAMIAWHLDSRSYQICNEINHKRRVGSVIDSWPHQLY